ncbi:hypothetical protein [Quisquiliibacterium transsilvanicum]|uniref:Uncharacterized protein n=1 Tax=Quisquiliibacterium transsilvanicum TaxID=1549638 RepID=A0A7W8HFN1_9BURK|nr:hypothetical protein [Quisquiliibacterium transsilvanicum]MBB5270315.1 hypothetical protein [Quisquiliibacterium transsilvanicum]
MKLPDFLGLRSVIQSASAQKRDLDERILELQRKRSTVEAAPAAKSVVKSFIAGRMRAAASGYETMMQQAVRPFAIQGFRMGIHEHVAGPGRPTLFPATDVDPRALDQALCFLLRDQAEKAVAATIDAMQDWPPNAMTAEQRAAELTRIDAELDKLTSARDELVRNADAAGITLD